MTDHQKWQRETAVAYFRRSDSAIPRQTRVSSCAAYTGATIADVDRWLRAVGL
jgi:hypothetical protein